MGTFYKSKEELKPIARCKRCGNYHEVKDSNPPGLQYVKCPTDGSLFLVGIDGYGIIDADGNSITSDNAKPDDGNPIIEV